MLIIMKYNKKYTNFGILNSHDKMFYVVDWVDNKNGEKFLNDLKKQSKGLWEKTFEILRLIKDSNFQKMPYWKPLGDGLFEVRSKFGKLHSRIYCCYRKKNKIFLLCGAITQDKSQQKRDIKRARHLKNKL